MSSKVNHPEKMNRPVECLLLGREEHCLAVIIKGVLVICCHKFLIQVLIPAVEMNRPVECLLLGREERMVLVTMLHVMDAIYTL